MTAVGNSDKMKFRIFDTIVEIAGECPVGEYIRSELSEMPDADGAADVEIDIVSGFNESKHSRSSLPSIHAGTVHLDRRTSVPIRGIKDGIHNYVGTIGRQIDASINRNLTQIQIRYDERINNCDPFSKNILQLLSKDFLERSQNVAKVILYNDIEPLLHQIILEKSNAFIHASCLARNGSGVLFSGWGGAGKTSIATNLLSSQDWKFVSDDLCLLSADETVQPYLKRIQIYPYNISKSDQSQIMSGRSILNRLNWYGRSTMLGKKAVRRRSLPSDLYSICEDTRIPVSQLIYLVREHSEQITHEQISSEMAAKRAAATIGNEFRTHLKDLQALTAMYPDHWCSVEALVSNTQAVYESAFNSIPCTLVRIPPKTKPPGLTKYIQKNVLLSD